MRRPVHRHPHARAMGMGERVAHRLLHEPVGEHVSHLVQLADVALDWPPSPPPPLLVGAVKPRTIALAGELSDGVILTGGPGTERRWDSLDHAATLVAQGKLSLPVQQTFALEQVAEAERLSQEGHLSGKLVVLVD